MLTAAINILFEAWEISILKLPISDPFTFFNLISLSSGRSGCGGTLSGSKLNLLDLYVLVGMNVVVVNPQDDLGSAMFGNEGECFVTRLKLSKLPVREPKCD